MASTRGNDECRMPNDEGMTNVESPNSSFGSPSSFVIRPLDSIRHSSFVIGASSWWHRLVRPKGNLGTGGKLVLLLLAGVPLLLVLCRIAAYPEGIGQGGVLAFLRPLGVILNNHWSLT